jgi:hypothetical protein
MADLDSRLDNLSLSPNQTDSLASGHVLRTVRLGFFVPRVCLSDVPHTAPSKKRSQRFTVAVSSQPAPPLPGHALDPSISSASSVSSESGPYSPPQHAQTLSSAFGQAGPYPSGFPQVASPPQSTPASSLNASSGQSQRRALPEQWIGSTPQDDEIIPVACVIKNIPFSLPREDLLAIIVRKVGSLSLRNVADLFSS